MTPPSSAFMHNVLRRVDERAARIVLVAGARPNFMKVAPVLRALETHRDDVVTSLVHTGQHYDDSLSAVMFEQLGLPAADACLNVGSGPHGAQTGRIMTAF